MNIGLDYGHGVGQDRGASGLITEEWGIKVFGDELNNILKSKHQVFMLRPSSATTVSNSIWQRYTKANELNLDLVIPIHLNSASNASATGSEIFTWKANKDPRAIKILDGFNKELGYANRGIKDGGSLGMVKSCKAPVLYLELCFVVNSKDVETFKAHYKKMARIVANAIDSSITITEETDLVCIDVPKVGTEYIGDKFPTIGGWVINNINEYSLYVNGAKCDTKKTWVKRPDVKKVYGTTIDTLGFDHGIATSVLKCGQNKIAIKGKNVEKSVDIIYKCCDKCKH